MLGDVTDVDGPSLSIASVSVASGGGSLVNNGNGTLTFTPAANFNGAVSFSYTASDGALSASSTVSLTLAAVNDAPVAIADTLAATEDTAVTYTAAQLLGNDTDVDAQPAAVDRLGDQRHRRHGGAQRQRHGDLHAECQLQRRGELQLHRDRRRQHQQRRRP